MTGPIYAYSLSHFDIPLILPIEQRTLDKLGRQRELLFLAIALGLVVTVRYRWEDVSFGLTSLLIFDFISCSRTDDPLIEDAEEVHCDGILV